MRVFWRTGALVVCATMLLTGCPKGNADFKEGKRAESLQDWDTALIHYQRALQAEPLNAEYKLKVARIRFEAGQWHVRQGQKFRQKGELTLALAEFEKATAIDPASAIADQELRQVLALIAERNKPAGESRTAPPTTEEILMEVPPQLKLMNRDPVNLKLAAEARLVFESVAKLAGLGVIFDPDFASRRITVEISGVTMEDALDIVALQSKAIWKPVTPTVIFVAPDNQQKRREFEEYIIRTFYLSNTVQPQELTEITTGLRQLLDLRRIQQVNSQNAIVIRDTVDKIRLAAKIIKDIDKAKSEVVVQVFILQARRDRTRELGITPGSSAILGFTPQNPTSTDSSSDSNSQLSLNDLKHLSTKDYSITLPGATARALMTDSKTKIIQNPEIRVVDGAQAKLRVGDRVPVATGSFQAGVGVGVGGTSAAGVVNPLVNTQFTYLDVGVNIDITPRIHPNGEVSMKVSVEVSSVASRVNIGGIEQPIIAQRKIDHDIRLKEGESNVLAGLIERSETKSKSGWPGLGSVPLLGYLFAQRTTNESESEVLILLTPRLVRKQEILRENLASIASGTDTNYQVRSDPNAPRPQAPAPSPQPPGQGAGTQQTPPQSSAPAASQQPTPAGGAPSGQQQGRPARLRFEPATVNLKPGETTTIGVVVEDVSDLYAIPMLLKYDPAVISVEEVRHGGFLSGGTQEIAIVQRIDKEKGQAIVAAQRQANTAGVSGSGTLVGVVIKALAPGTTTLAVVQVNAKDSQQRPIALVSGECAIRVQP